MRRRCGLVLAASLYRRLLPGAGAFTPDIELPVATGYDYAGNFIVQDPPPSKRLVLITPRCCGIPGTYALTSTNGGATWSAAVPVYEGGPAVNSKSGRVNLVADAGGGGIYVMQGNPDSPIPTARTSGPA